MTRCKWCNENNPAYVKYHDEEWGAPNFDEGYLFEMLVLESFQAGLSWECILNKRESFRAAFDGFDPEKVCAYDGAKQAQLAQNKGIVRNRLKIKASVTNARIFRDIAAEFGTFGKYLETFTGGKTYFEVGKTTSPCPTAFPPTLKSVE